MDTLTPTDAPETLEQASPLLDDSHGPFETYEDPKANEEPESRTNVNTKRPPKASKTRKSLNRSYGYQEAPAAGLNLKDIGSERGVQVRPGPPAVTPLYALH